MTNTRHIADPGSGVRLGWHILCGGAHRNFKRSQPAAYVTRNGGRTWQRLDEGLPEAQAWWTLKRQAMTVDAQAVPALYLGTTTGELWIGREEGARWTNIARHLPEIYAVEVAELA